MCELFRERNKIKMVLDVAEAESQAPGGMDASEVGAPIKAAAKRELHLLVRASAI